MTRVLHAWLEGHYAGRFTRNSNGPVEFHYASDAPATPISLSLPRDGGSIRRAAGNFLENLLPDNAAVRKWMAAAYGIESTDTFDLLSAAGGDVAGGLVLSSDDEEVSAGPLILDPAGSRDIAARIAGIKRDPDVWVDSRNPTRFSLAGTQGKFALADIGGEWYWSNATVPSTHIVKPARSDLVGLEAAEATALRLAAAVGVEAPAARVLTVEDQTAYLVERFDRGWPGQIAVRLHAEDLAQAMGKSPDHKYDISARQAIELLRDRIDAETAYEFVRQLAFNTFIGNADAHGKNYSVLLRPERVTLSPIYDAVPVGLFPQFDQVLAMPIAGAKHVAAVTPNHWRKLARTSGLDEARVKQLVSDLAGSLRAKVESVSFVADSPLTSRIGDLIRRNVEAFG